MKFALALLALVATVSGRGIEIPNFGRGELYKDIQAFLDILPQEKILGILTQYIAEDDEVMAIIEYLQTDEFKELVTDVESLSEVEDLMNYIHEAGIDIYRIVNMLNDYIGLDHLTPPDFTKRVHKQISGGLRGLVDDIMAILPVDELNAMYEDKLENSPDFADFIDQLKSDNFQRIVNTVYAHPTFQKLVKQAKDAGLDLEVVKDLLKVLWGIDVPSRPRFHVHKA